MEIDEKDKKFGNRGKRQKEEGYEEVSTKLPAGRFSSTKQVLNPDELGGADSPATGNTSGATTAKAAAVNIKSKLKIAPDVSVEVLDGKQVGGVPLESGGVTKSMAGFSNHSTVDDESRIPYQGGRYRPDTRYGKKRSEDLFELDNTVSEQIAPVVDDAQDLRDAPGAKQGYNGRKQFTQVRGKKNFVGDSRSLLYEASADLEFHSHIIATTGQVIKPLDTQADYPTRSYADNNSNGFAVDNPLKKSNYLLTGLNIVVNGTTKRIKAMSFNETELETNTDPLTRDESNLNWQVDAHRVAKSMIRMQTELGRETTDKWSPLGYVIGQPYEYNMLMHDIEATTGAIMAIAYRASVSSLSYQRNILNKDGIGPQRGAINMFAEDWAGMLTTSEAYNSLELRDMVFNGNMYRAGSAAALIEMFDSIPKYRTKADILGLQRSLPLHLSQADNNINPLHCKPEFMKVLNKAHVFSTKTGTYNPLLPIHVTKTIKLLNPLSLNFFLQDWKHPKDFVAADYADIRRDQTTGTYSKYGYRYSDLRNTYNTRVQHPIVEGLIHWLLKHEGAFVSTMLKDTNESGDVNIYIPAHFDFTNPGLFEFLLCSASQYVAWQRNITFRDILFAGEQSSYIWDDLSSLKDMDPLHSTQLTIPGYNQDLKLGSLADDTAIRYYWGDSMPLVHHDTTGYNQDSFALPWYFNETVFTDGATAYTQGEGFREERRAFNMSIPSIRDGVRHEYVDIIKSMDERDVRLSLDRITEIPRFTEYTARGNGYAAKISLVSTSNVLQNNITLRALRYDNNSDGRVIVEYNTGVVGASRDIPEASKYCVAKELGWIWDYPASLISPVTAIAVNAGTKAVSVTYAQPARAENFTDGVMIGGTSVAIRSYRVESNAFRDGSIDRSAALTQGFRTAFANPNYATVNAAYTAYCGLALNTSYNGNGVEFTNCLYYTNGGIHAMPSGFSGFSSKNRVTWSMIQRVFHPVNPFENCYVDITSTTADRFDPLENSFYFGVCGTLASDYTQDVLERLDVLDQLDLDYVEDVFIKDSLIFRA